MPIVVRIVRCRDMCFPLVSDGSDAICLLSIVMCVYSNIQRFCKISTRTSDIGEIKSIDCLSCSQFSVVNPLFRPSPAAHFATCAQLSR